MSFGKKSKGETTEKGKGSSRETNQKAKEKKEEEKTGRKGGDGGTATATAAAARLRPNTRVTAALLPVVVRAATLRARSRSSRPASVTAQGRPTSALPRLRPTDPAFTKPTPPRLLQARSPASRRDSCKPEAPPLVEAPCCWVLLCSDTTASPASSRRRPCEAAFYSLPAAPPVPL
ncbi:hypothetical protein ACJRO7_019176 [Eucalyptus globulus]|uniref:Uncharacterized protein n=1 Tax=Eucalyptus globulus TaxID=34317 RepID=A0ABD3KP69_EUCGL